MLDHVNILLVVDVDLHFAPFIQWHKQELLNAINQSLQNLSDYRCLFNQDQVAHGFKFYVAEHTKEGLPILGGLLYFPEVSVDLCLVNPIITDSIQLELQLLWINTE